MSYILPLSKVNLQNYKNISQTGQGISYDDLLLMRIPFDSSQVDGVSIIYWLTPLFQSDTYSFSTTGDNSVFSLYRF